MISQNVLLALAMRKGGGGGSGSGDMTKAVYDTDNNGIVDNSQKVSGYTGKEIMDGINSKVSASVDGENVTFS